MRQDDAGCQRFNSIPERSGDPISAVIYGQDLIDQANASWRERKQDYRGLGYRVAVGIAKGQIEKHRGNRKDRQAEAEHWVAVTFTHARNQSPDVMTAVAAQAQSVAAGGAMMAGSALEDFATEVAQQINGVLSGGFGVIDFITLLPLIMNMITGIVQAIQQCKALKPTPAPTPTPNPTPNPTPQLS